MMRPPRWDGVVFSQGEDGDLKNDHSARDRLARKLGLTEAWAVVHQVHGNHVIRVSEGGDHGAGDALWSSEPRLPLAVFTADCFGVALLAETAVGVAHVGWRGADLGVARALRQEMAAGGHEPHMAAVGPGIRSCCFEVGTEVAERFPGHVTTTSWGTTSVDLPAVISAELDGLETWHAPACTRHEEGWHSHRRDATTRRMATLAWLS